ncbi:unnamed protein product, partial [Coffea canephora]
DVLFLYQSVHLFFFFVVAITGFLLSQIGRVCTQKSEEIINSLGQFNNALWVGLKVLYEGVPTIGFLLEHNKEVEKALIIGAWKYDAGHSNRLLFENNQILLCFDLYRTKFK